MAINIADIKAKLGAVLDKVRDLLKGEPARAIGYGGAVVVYLVAAAFGRIPDVTFDQAVTMAVTALAIVASFVETIRRYVYSPNTVSEIIEDITEGVEFETDPSGDVPFEGDPLDDEEPSA